MVQETVRWVANLCQLAVLPWSGYKPVSLEPAYVMHESMTGREFFEDLALQCKCIYYKGITTDNVQVGLWRLTKAPY